MAPLWPRSPAIEQCGSAADDARCRCGPTGVADRMGRVKSGLSAASCRPRRGSEPSFTSCETPGAAWSMRTFERGSNVARRPSACGRMRLVAELLLGPQTPCMRRRSIPGVSFHADRLLERPPWSPVVKFGWLGYCGRHTRRARRGPTSRSGHRYAHKELFSCGFLWHTAPQSVSPHFRDPQNHVS